MSLAYRLSAYNRARKWRLFQEVIKPQADWAILDVGFSEKEYSVTDNYLEKHYPRPEKITALGIDTPRQFKQRYPLVKTATYDGQKFPFPDKSFDLVWSNAVLEHVGSQARQILFLKEIVRVGQHAFITTPNRNFPIEIHTRLPLLHFLPKKIFDAILRCLGMKWATGDYLNLVSLRQLKKLLAAARIERYSIISNRFLGFVVDFVVII